MGPSVDNLIKERAELVKDYDSYQRRLKVLQEKKKQAQGKPAEAEATGINIFSFISFLSSYCSNRSLQSGSCKIWRKGTKSQRSLWSK